MQEVGLCAFRPTFIGQFEHSADDVTAMIKHVGIRPGSVQLPWLNAGHGLHGQHNATGVSAVHLYPAAAITRLQKLYMHDFEAFGYPNTPS